MRNISASRGFLATARLACSSQICRVLRGLAYSSPTCTRCSCNERRVFLCSFWASCFVEICTSTIDIACTTHDIRAAVSQWGEEEEYLFANWITHSHVHQIKLKHIPKAGYQKSKRLSTLAAQTHENETRSSATAQKTGRQLHPFRIHFIMLLLWIWLLGT